MSTSQQEIVERIPDGVLSSNTIAQSLLRDQRDQRLEPVDLRTRRFGYNPGFLMMLDPTISGLQTTLIPAQQLLTFETATVKRQSRSVDPHDQSPPDEEFDLLAGAGLRDIYQNYAHMGFRELLPLRGLGDIGAGNLFYSVHPTLREVHELGVIEPCPHKLDICITCRASYLETISAPEKAAPLLDVLKESVAVGRAYMAEQWRTWVGEIASNTPGASGEMALKKLSDGHLYFMRQLHERTPNELELEKIAVNAKAQAAVMQETMKEFAQTMGANRSESAELADLRRRLAAVEQAAAKPAGSGEDNPAEPAK